MLKIGLTGGIGSGKSTATNFFAELGAPIIDADVISREIIESDLGIRTKIVEHFGKEILDPSGNLDRTALRNIIFQIPAERHWLEAVLHPLIIAEIQQRSKKISAPYCIIAIPLLVEANETHTLVDRVLVIDTTEESQLARTQQRDGISKTLANHMLNSQAERIQRLQIADDIIHNDQDLETLQHEVEKLHRFYLQLSNRDKT